MNAAELEALAAELGLDAIGAARAEPHVSLADWLNADPDELRQRYARLYVPRNDGRRLQLNAQIAAENLAAEESNVA